MGSICRKSGPARRRVEKMIKLLNDARAIVKRRADEAATTQTALGAAQVRANAC